MTPRFASEQQPRQQGGPPLVLLATISLLLLIAGLALSAALGGVIPSPFGDATAIQDYFAQTSDAVRASAVCLFGSAIPLAIYAATASSRLRSGPPHPARPSPWLGG